MLSPGFTSHPSSWGHRGYGLGWTVGGLERAPFIPAVPRAYLSYPILFNLLLGNEREPVDLPPDEWGLSRPR